VTAPRPLRSFDELGTALRQQAREAAAAAAAERRRQQLLAEEQRRREREQQAFARAVGPVTRLPDSGRAPVSVPLPLPLPRMREADERAALQAALSDEVDVESLLLTDDGLSFRRAGIGPDVLTRLRRGQWAIQRQIDLHGLRRDEAREALALFLRQTRQQGVRCLRVVHGKGLGSPGREPVLKGKVQRWLAQCDEVIAFAQASGPQGGAGALIVLLAP
jgi:DNA-nicking Smr family endonuclease